jgi:hypothetical protein
MDKKYTTLTIRKETSHKLRRLAIDEDMRMNDLINVLVDSYLSNKTKLDFVDDDLKEMGETKLKGKPKASPGVDKKET